MEVRLARAADAEAIRAIYNAEVTGSTVTFDLEPRTLDEQRAWIAEHQGVHPAVVAVDAESVAGFGSLSPYRDRPAYSTTVEDSVYVGRRLARPGRRSAHPRRARRPRRAAGASTPSSPGSSGDNEASIALHRACGFQLVGVEREVGRKFGRWLDVAVMQRML